MRKSVVKVAPGLEGYVEGFPPAFLAKRPEGWVVVIRSGVAKVAPPPDREYNHDAGEAGGGSPEAP